VKTAAIFSFDTHAVHGGGHAPDQPAPLQARQPLPEIRFDALDDEIERVPAVPEGVPVAMPATPSAIEAMQHVVEKLVRLWGTRDLNTFLHGLLLDSRDGTRKGFPVEAAAELVMLVKINLIVRAEAAAPLLGVPFAEACALIARGDHDALGHPEFVHDSWGVHGAGIARRNVRGH
jgi:hypothetical protein